MTKWHWPLMAWLWIVPAPAFALCNGIETLKKIHNAYFALASTQGDTRLRAAARLYPMLDAIDPVTFEESIELNFEKNRWFDIHKSAAHLARSVTSGIKLSERMLAPHTENIAWLQRLILASPCNAPGVLTRQVVLAGNDIIHLPINVQPTSSHTDQSNTAQLLLIPLFTILAFATALCVMWKSQTVRRFRADRLPRSLIDLNLNLTTDADGKLPETYNVQALDVSLGGMKVKIEVTLKINVHFDLELPIGPRGGCVVWSNPHYAGLLFDHQLTQGELDDLIAENANSPRKTEADQA